MKLKGCHNRLPLGSRPIPIQDGWFIDGVTRTPRLVPLPFRMTPDCVYTTSELGRTDPGCVGCRWKTEAAADSAETP